MATTEDDWTSDRIKAAIHKMGSSCAALSRSHGFSAAAVANALRRPWPAVEAVIATHIGIPPHRIWPSRYAADGRPRAGGWAYPKRRSGAAHCLNGGAA